MSTADRRQPVRWLLLAILALALVVMHHAPADHDSPGHGAAAVVAMAAGPSVAPAPDDDHGMGAMLHECLAVLAQLAAGAMLALLLAVGVARLMGRRLPPRWRARARALDRPDGPGGRSLLASVCVLRL